MPRRILWGLTAGALLAPPAWAGPEVGGQVQVPAAAASPAALVRWEYRVLTYDRVAMFSDSQHELRMLGLLGWELVGVTFDPNARTIVCFFKRPLPR
ncbi:MAG: hypothetical protein VKQ33_14255 [Candidatus Sericytochromatia bacterium]|nr:hypothetical protein [Candidatus Sericytochromatia bacterium]